MLSFMICGPGTCGPCLPYRPRLPTTPFQPHWPPSDMPSVPWPQGLCTCCPFCSESSSPRPMQLTSFPPAGLSSDEAPQETCPDPAGHPIHTPRSSLSRSLVSLFQPLTWPEEHLSVLHIHCLLPSGEPKLPEDWRLSFLCHIPSA